MPTLALTLEDGSPLTVPLDADLVTLGRDPGSTIPLSCPSVSGHHAILKLRDEGWLVQDLGSSNGTRVNGATVEEAFLNEGDQIGFGDIVGIFYQGEAPAMPPPAIEEPAEDEVAPAPPPPQRVAPKRRKVSRTDPSVHGEEGGCFSTLLIMLLFIGSMLIGLAIRHNQETDRNLFSDLIDKMTGSMPKIKFEKRVDEE